MRNKLFLVVLLALFASVGCYRNLETISNKSPYQDLTLEQMRGAIMRGCMAHDWQIREIDDNTIEATVTVRNKHRAVVSIPYTNTQYTIKYKDSVGLKYKDKGGEIKIHGSYNRWIHYLDNSIQEEIAALKYEQSKNEQLKSQSGE